MAASRDARSAKGDGFAPGRAAGNLPEVRGFTARDVVAGPGRQLAEPVRVEMEERLGADFTDVRVHTGAAAHASAEGLGARAYTAGSHIVFQQGFGDGTTAAGKAVLAHELAHVIQQRQGPVAGSAAGEGLAVSDPDDSFERAAEATARRAMGRQIGDRPAGAHSDGVHSAGVHPPGVHSDGVRPAGGSPPSGPGTLAIQRLLANVWWDRTPAPAGPKVMDAATERGSGTAGGAHSTAHTVFEWAAVNAVRHKNFPGAVAALLALVAGVKDLPGYKIAGAGAKNALDAEITRIEGLPDYAKPATVPPVEHTQVLQDLMVDYLKLRNTVPGTYISGKSGTKGIKEKDEKKGAQAMIAARTALMAGGPDPGGQNTKLFANGMRLTFDTDILPDVKGTGAAAWGNALGQHIITVFQAFPDIPTAKQESIQKVFLTQIFKDLKLSSRQWNTVANLVPPYTGIPFPGF